MKQFILISLVLYTVSCTSKDKELPILGERKVEKKFSNGQESVDTLYHIVGKFSFVNQFKDTIDSDKLKGKVYVASSFFTTCPTVCHRLMEESLEGVNEALGNEKDFYILSHTVNPSYDTPNILNEYSGKFKIKGNNWYFLTGLQDDSLYNFLGEKYFITAGKELENSGSGGFVHSASIVLIDRDQRIRGIYDGMDKKQIGKIVEDANSLLHPNQN